MCVGGGAQDRIATAVFRFFAVSRLVDAFDGVISLTLDPRTCRRASGPRDPYNLGSSDSHDILADLSR